MKYIILLLIVSTALIYQNCSQGFDAISQSSVSVDDMILKRSRPGDIIVGTFTEGASCDHKEQCDCEGNYCEVIPTGGYGTYWINGCDKDAIEIECKDGQIIHSKTLPGTAVEGVPASSDESDGINCFPDRQCPSGTTFSCNGRKYKSHGGDYCLKQEDGWPDLPCSFTEGAAYKGVCAGYPKDDSDPPSDDPPNDDPPGDDPPNDDSGDDFSDEYADGKNFTCNGREYKSNGDKYCLKWKEGWPKLPCSTINGHYGGVCNGYPKDSGGDDPGNDDPGDDDSVDEFGQQFPDGKEWTCNGRKYKSNGSRYCMLWREGWPDLPCSGWESRYNGFCSGYGPDNSGGGDPPSGGSCPAGTTPQSQCGPGGRGCMDSNGNFVTWANPPNC